MCNVIWLLRTQKPGDFFAISAIVNRSYRVFVDGSFLSVLTFYL
jgi:hypothetical protein